MFGDCQTRCVVGCPVGRIAFPVIQDIYDGFLLIDAMTVSEVPQRVRRAGSRCVERCSWRRIIIRWYLWAGRRTLWRRVQRRSTGAVAGEPGDGRRGRRQCSVKTVVCCGDSAIQSRSAVRLRAGRFSTRTTLRTQHNGGEMPNCRNEGDDVDVRSSGGKCWPNYEMSRIPFPLRRNRHRPTNRSTDHHP